MRQRPKLGEILIEDGALTDEDIERAVALQGERRGRLGQILLDEGMVSPVTLLRSLARQFGVELVDLTTFPIDMEAVTAIPAALSRRHRALGIAKQDGVLIVAMANPTDLTAVDDIRVMTGYPVRPVMAETQQLVDALDRYWAGTGAVTTNLQDGEGAGNGEVYVKFVEKLFERAIADRASDLHLEPEPEGLRIRFRVDGVLHDAGRAPTEVVAGTIGRMKILGGMDIGERRLPQDGRCSFELNGRSVDLRVATVPTIHGEAVVVRVLDERPEVQKIDALGFSPHALDRLKTCFSKPNGLVLVTGPTGSGKTTTLYAGLRELNRPERNLITVEDPVEVALPGVKQVQVNRRAGLTFATLLRSLLRADPDVVLIGEIRDVETASIAVEASLTGHLVMSSIHTNDAASTPARLVEMGVDPFLVATSLSAIVAQRLTRKLCERCAEEYKPDDHELSLVHMEVAAYGIGAGERPHFRRAVGCTMCAGTGYRGRVAILEVLSMNPELTAAIGKSATGDEIREIATLQGTETMRDDAHTKLLAGLTSVEEVLRVLA